MNIRNAAPEDFETAFAFIETLWDYNTYDRAETRAVYDAVLADPSSFAFFLEDDDGRALGFCHGAFFNTFWLAGETCYLSSLIVAEDARRQGLGTMLMDHACALARERGCKGVVLDSGLPRTGAHAFYERYGFEKSCYGFDYYLKA